MSRRKSKYVELVEEINLIPIMNLVLCLIPLVLFKTQLVKIGMVNMSAPSFGPSPPKPEPTDEKPLGLTVALSKDGFELKATGANLFEVLPGLTQEGEATGVKIKKITDTYYDKKGNPLQIQSYNYVKLYEYLSILKGKYPKEKLLTLSGDPDLEFKHLIRVMDIVRFKFEDDTSFKKIEDISKAAENFQYKKVKETIIGDDGKETTVETYESLWDQVTFAIVQ